MRSTARRRRRSSAGVHDNPEHGSWSLRRWVLDREAHQGWPSVTMFFAGSTSLKYVDEDAGIAGLLSAITYEIRLDDHAVDMWESVAKHKPGDGKDRVQVERSAAGWESSWSLCEINHVVWETVSEENHGGSSIIIAVTLI